MKKYTRFSSKASLAAVGINMRQRKIWERIEQEVHIRQKTIKHKPMDKLLDGLINILAGGRGVVEANTRVGPDKALQRAFGREGCADQSTISETLNACSEENVRQMRQALGEVYRQHGRGYRHRYESSYQVMDVDMTGLVAGEQAEGASKGFFPEQRNRRGRQLGRVLASRYDEIVFEKLYAGSVQLDVSLQELVLGAEEVLRLSAERRCRVILRVDGGGGKDADINWMLERDYFILTKVKNWKRSAKLAQSVQQWIPDPKVPGRQMGWVQEPHSYSRPTRQLALRWLKENSEWHYRVLVFNLTDPMLFDLARHPLPVGDVSQELLSAIVDAYDLRGGGVETSNKGSKQGLGLASRNKRRFPAQEMLVLLTQLAYNLTSWARHELSKHFPAFQHFGMLRMIRDVFQISGKLQMNAQGQILQIQLNRNHNLAPPFQKAFQPLLSTDNLYLVLRQI